MEKEPEIVKIIDADEFIKIMESLIESVDLPDLSEIPEYFVESEV